MKWLITYFLMGVVFQCCTQILPGYKNGSWWIISDGKTISLSASITHLGNFDSLSRTAEFIENNHYGILNSEGELVLEPRFTSIHALGKGLFECSDSSATVVLDVSNNEILFRNVNEIVALNDAYLLIRQNDSIKTLFYLEKRISFSFKDSSVILYAQWNTIYLKENDSVNVFYTPEGNKFEVPAKDVQFYHDKLVYTLGDETTLITAKFNRKFLKNPQIQITGKYVSFYENGMANLLNPETGVIEKSVPFEQIVPTYFGGYFVTKNGKTGWMNEAGEMKIPVAYDRIYKSGKDYIVSNGELSGQYNEDYKLVVPVAFYSFYLQGNFLRTHSVLGNQGVYSLVLNRTILEPIYSKIEFNGSLIKGYYKNNIRILELSEQHYIKSDIILENAITVKQSTFSPHDAAHSFDKRLLSLGWFFEKVPTHDASGNPVSYSYSWGLKTPSDSILIKPVLKSPLFIPNQRFSLVKVKEKVTKGNMQVAPEYKMRDYSTGKILQNFSIIGLDTIDCSFRQYARMYTSEGYRVLLPNDSIKTVSYVGHQYGKYVPYCIGGKVETSKDGGDDYIEKSNYLVYGTFNNTQLTGFSWNPNENKFQKFTDAKWNYLDSSGNDLFAEPFEFAQEFLNRRAIVKKAGSWGVISEDSVIIPFKFAEIKRIPQLGDSIFLVKQNQVGKEVLNENAKSLDLGKVGSIKYNGNLTVVTKGSEQLVYRNNQLENSTSSSILLLGNDEYAVSEKKEYKIIDGAGKEVGISAFKPDKIIGDQLLIIEDKSKVGLATIHGDTIFSPNKQTFEQVGTFIIKRSKSSNAILDLKGKTILMISGEYPFFVDPVSATIAVLKDTKAQIFDKAGKSIRKLKLSSMHPITDYYAGCFFSKSLIQSLEQELILGKEHFYSVFSNGHFAVFSSNHHIDMYKDGLHNKLFSCEAKRITEIGSGIFAYPTRGGLTIRKDRIEKQFPSNTFVEEKFQDQFCLLRTNNSYFFINESFENPFHRTFLDATPFQQGLASIKISSGWTILSASGIQKTYPSFSKITQLGNGLFETLKKPIYGIIDHNGQEIIPCTYEKIEFLSPGIFKVIKQGEIGYYDRNGRVIFETLGR